MKNILKICSIFLAGLIVVLTSCEKKYPFPDPARVTIIDLRRVDDGAAFLTTVTPTSTQFTFELKRFEYGGNYAIEKVEFCVAVIDANGAGTDAILETFPGNVFFGSHELDFPVQTVNVTLQEVFDATGTSNADWTGGERVLFFYRIYMQNGSTFIGWTQASGDVTRTAGGAPQGVFDMLRDEDGNRIAGSVPLSVICGVTIDDFLGEWRYTTPWGNGPWFGNNGILDAEIDPGNPNAIIFTMQEGTWANNGWNRGLRIVLNFDTYTWTVARQNVIINDETFVGGWPWNDAWTEVGIWAGSGIIDGCLYPALRFSWTANVTNGAGSGWGSVVHTLTRIP